MDNDDGSSYYRTHHNFLVYGNQGMKNDFGGHDNHHHDNVYAYLGSAAVGADTPMNDGHEDHFERNKARSRAISGISRAHLDESRVNLG